MSEATCMFVYGTLRRGIGHPMAEWLAARSEWLGRVALEAASMVVLEGYPGIVAGEGRVIGDLCRVHRGWERQVLQVLDNYEGIDAVLGYERRLVTVRLGKGDVEAWAYYYCGSIAGRRQVREGDWLAWIGEGSQDERVG